MPYEDYLKREIESLGKFLRSLLSHMSKSSSDEETTQMINSSLLSEYADSEAESYFSEAISLHRIALKERLNRL